MSGLRQTSSVLSNLGKLHMVTAVITLSSGTPSVTTNDATLTVSDNGAGDYKLTYEAFLTVPTAIVSGLKGTHSDTTHNAVLVENLSTTVMDVRWLESVDASANSSPDCADDEEIHVLLIGLRSK